MTPAILLTLATVPFSGALIRWRVHYSPKRIQLEDSEAGQESAHATLTVTGYFSTLKRVYQLEGWAGLFKGLLPMFLTFAIKLFSLVGLITIVHKIRLPFSLSLWKMGFDMVVIGIPMQVFTARAVVTPYRLSYMKPSAAFKLLLSPTERRQPWRLYLLPGLAASQFCLVLTSFLIYPLFSGMRHSTPLLAGLKLIVYFSFGLAWTTLQTPLLNVNSRLAVQRIHKGDDVEISEAEVAAAIGIQVYSNEEVIVLREEEDPYKGVFDCLKKVIAEEGWKSLFRAWWITALSFLQFAHILWMVNV
ncbi:hypothetical protein L218DRAFT_963944 [Marasmius fiardii PR-910]|nr:hypothetical protein L218DRAFT_963944 [Marasmius fiardii PR-910]